MRSATHFRHSSDGHELRDAVGARNVAATDYCTDRREGTNDASSSYSVASSKSSGRIMMTDFRTPRETTTGGRGGGGGRKKWSRTDDLADGNGALYESYDRGDDDEDELFFSPLAQHAVHTPSYSFKCDAVAPEGRECSVDAAGSCGPLSVSHSAVPSDGVPPDPTPAPPRLSDAAAAVEMPPSSSSSSPKYLEVREELKSLLSEARGLSSPPSDTTTGESRSKLFTSSSDRPAAAKVEEAVESAPTFAPPNPTPSHYGGAVGRTPPAATSTAAFARQLATGSGRNPSSSPPCAPQSPATSTSFHLHSRSVSSLPRDALTVDFVRQCDDVETLGAILGLLSDNNGEGGNQHNAAAVGKGLVPRGGSGKQCRYPSLVRLVERRLRRIEEEQEGVGLVHENGKAGEKRQPFEQRAGDKKHEAPRPDTPDGGSNKENMHPDELMPIHDNGRPPSRPMDSITLLSDFSEDASCTLELDVEGSAITTTAVSPSPTFAGTTTVLESSLDMNLSESQSLLLDDESFFWKQGTGAEEGKRETKEVEQHPPSLSAGKKFATKQRGQDKSCQTEEDEELGEIRRQYAELKEQLDAALSSEARLTGEVNSLVDKHETTKHELSSKLKQAKDQLSQLRIDRQKQVAKLESVNVDLHDEVRRLHEQLHRVSHNAEDASRRMQSELDDARADNATISKDKDRLSSELNVMRSRYNAAQKEIAKLKHFLNKKSASSESDSIRKMQRVVESAKMANQALANALAVSEKDLADAVEVSSLSCLRLPMI